VDTPTVSRGILDDYIDEQSEIEETEAVSRIKNTNQDPDVMSAAKRFVKDRLGMDNVTDEEAMEEYIAHFRSFNVNEITAGGDYNYVSGLATDSETPMPNDTKNVKASAARARKALGNIGKLAKDRRKEIQEKKNNIS